MKKAQLKQIAKLNGIKIGKIVNGVWKEKTIKELKQELGNLDEFNGGSLSGSELNNFMENSYKKTLDDVGDYVIDKELSGQRVKVYHNPNTGKTIVSHRGTNSIQDVGTDIAMALGYKKGKRFTHSKNIQNQVKAKYGSDNITTLGHSLGGTLAETVGNKSGNNEVITFNKGALPGDIGKKMKKNQTDIKTTKDPVSILKKFQRGKKAVKIKSKTWNPLKEHSVSNLKYLNQEQQYGV